MNVAEPVPQNLHRYYFWTEKYLAYRTAQKLYYQQGAQFGSRKMINYPLLGDFLSVTKEIHPFDLAPDGLGFRLRKHTIPREAASRGILQRS